MQYTNLFSTGKDVDVYAAEKMYADQHIDRRKIGVDTARYIMS